MSTLDWITRLISFAVILQSLELFLTRKSWLAVWKWETLKKDYASTTQKVLSWFLEDKRFVVVLVLEIFISSVNFFIPTFWLSGVLFFMTFLTAVRWRGTFNGGSDYMTVLTLLSVFIAGCFPGNEKVELVCFGYIGIQVVLSYFIAGIAKVKQKSWRTGEALKDFLMHSNYPVNARIKKIAQKRQTVWLASRLILGFELLFPLALLDPRLCLFYLCLGFIFHLENFFDLGLNRFVFAWFAAYPALYYLSNSIHLMVFN